LSAVPSSWPGLVLGSIRWPLLGLFVLDLGRWRGLVLFPRCNSGFRLLVWESEMSGGAGAWSDAKDLLGVVLFPVGLCRLMLRTFSLIIRRR
jgi:hypothetical protein